MELCHGGRVKDVTKRVLLDLAFLTPLVIVWVLLLAHYFTPNFEGFFCDDLSIAYSLPNKETVPIWLLVPIVFFSSSFTFLLFELYQYHSTKRISKPEFIYSVCNIRVHPLVSALYQHVGVFTKGMVVVSLTGEAAKSQIGSLRPIFLAVCKPDWNITRCVDDRGMQRLVTEDVCQEEDETTLIDIRLSFPSSHGVVASYCFVYLALYVQAKMTCEGIQAVKYLVQAGFMYVAIYISLSRVADHYHHLSDVIAGMLYGATAAILVVRFKTRYLGFCRTQYSEEVSLQNVISTYERRKDRRERFEDMTENSLVDSENQTLLGVQDSDEELENSTQ